MIDRLDSALRHWIRILNGWELYPADHPAVRAAQQEAAGELRAMLETVGPVDLVVIDGRFLYRNETIPCSANLMDSMGEVLRGMHVDRIRLTPGLTEVEMVEFLHGVAGAASGTSMLRETAHVQFGFLVRGPGEGGDGGDGAVVAPAEPATLVAGVHEQAARAGRVDLASVTEVVGQVAGLVESHAHTMLPLAQLKSHDEYTFVHTVNVAVLSAATMRALGHPRSAVHDVMIAAILHDIGKQRCPLEVLNKNGRLTSEEVAIIRRHPVDGARILLQTPGLPDIAAVVAYEHHLKLDGSGYPDVPAGWTPSLESRVVQLADMYDALRSNRPYRAGLPTEEIEKILRAEAGVALDADLLEFFLERVAGAALRPPAAV